MMDLKAVGVIVEYNPFHNGHAYHLQQAKDKSEADVTIAVMSGNFLQRGEPALACKWTRTEIALANGADIVIELPYAFATQKAEVFAGGAVSLLSALQADYLCFGSEDGTIERFHELVTFMDQHQHTLNRLIKQEVNKGVSYPKAASNAFQVVKHERLLNLNLPNNILGYHYVKAIKDQKSSILPLTISRRAANYHDDTLHDSSIASATSIRKEIEQSASIQAIQKYVPANSFSKLKKGYDVFGKFVNWEELFPLLKYKLMTASLDELQTIYEIEEGIEHRFISKIQRATSFEHFIKLVKTKRFTWTRLQRMCTHLLTNAKKDEMYVALQTKKAKYIRLLGMSRAGQQYLNTVKKEFTLPFITNYSRDHRTLLKLDHQAACTYAMAFQPPEREKKLKKEISQPPIIWPTHKNL